MVPMNKPILEVKQEVERQQGTEIWKQQLMIGGVLLEDSQEVQNYADLSEDGRGYVMLIIGATFVPADQFVASPDLGYLFRDGDHGLGYYIDEDNAPWKRRQGQADEVTNAAG